MEDEEEGDEEVKEKYDKVVLGGNKGDKSKTHSGEDYEKDEEEEGDEEVKEKYDKVVLGGNKGDKSKTHSGEDYEKDEEEEGDEEVKESNVSEKEITNDADFKDYAFAILKDAHGDKFDEAKAMEVVDGLKDKYKGDYGAMVGALQATMGS